jgi:ribosome-binding protein aMBF1 (putative translation factor)
MCVGGRQTTVTYCNRSFITEKGERKKEKSQEKKKKRLPDKKHGTGDEVKSWILQPVDFVMRRHRGNRGLQQKRGAESESESQVVLERKSKSTFL